MKDAKFFLKADKKMAAFIDKTDESKSDIKEFVALVLFLYSQVFKWESKDYGFLKTTLREIASAFGYTGNTRQYNQIRTALCTALDEGYITDLTSGTPIARRKERPSDLLVIRFNQIAFEECESFVWADSDSLEKLFAAQKGLKMPKNCVVNVINLFFLLSCKIFKGSYQKHYSHKKLRRQLGLCDETLTECFNALHKMKLFSRKKIFNPAVENYQWHYFPGYLPEEETQENDERLWLPE